MREKRTITNYSGKRIAIMINPKDIFQRFYAVADWTITPSQWRRLVRESDDTEWKSELGETIRWKCLPYANGCMFPGQKTP